MFLPIDFYNLKKSIKIIDKLITKKNVKKIFIFKNKNFKKYLANE